jgi:transposase
MNIKWTDEDRQFIKDHAAFMKDVDIAKELEEKTGRKVTLDAVRKVRQKLGIKKKHGRGICGVIKQDVNKSKKTS